MRRFSDKAIEHFSNPQNVGIIERPEEIATITNPVCGDVTEIYLRIKEGIIEDAKFKSFGCAVTIASASVFTENIKGKEISKLVSGRDEETVRQLVGLVENELGGGIASTEASLSSSHCSGLPRSHFAVQ